MPYDKIDKLYDALKADGAVSKDREYFRGQMLAPGEQGYKNRKQLYEALKADGAVESPTYEDFAANLGLHAGKPERVPTQSYQPTQEEMAGFQQTIRSAGGVAQNPTQSYERKSKQMQKRQGLNVPKRVNLGESNNLTPTDQGYMTEAGNEYETKAIADMEQRQIEQAKRDERYLQTLPGQLEDAYAERDRLNAELAKYQGSWVDQDGRVHYNNRGDDESVASLQAALRQNQERITALEAERDDDGGTQFWRGFLDTAKNPSTLSFGLTDFDDMLQLMRIKSKIDSAKESGLEPQLSPAEQQLMESSYLNNYAQSAYGENRGFMYRAGGISMQALPFVAEFMATGGLSAISQKGAELGTKAAEKLALEGLKKSLVKNLGVVAGDVAAGWAMANTTGLFRTAGDVMQRNVGQVAIDEDGNLGFEGGKSLGRSIYEAEVANTLEYYTEKLGEHLKLGKWLSKGAEKMGLSRLSKAVNYLSGSKWLERGGIQDYPSEVVEEEANLLLNGILVGDNNFSVDPNSKDFDKSAFNPKTQLDIWGGMLFSIGLMQAPRLAYTGYNAAGYYAFKKNVDAADTNASIVFGQDNWQMIKDEIDSCDNDQLSSLLETVVNGDMSDEQKTATMNYAKNLITMRGYNMGMMADTKDEEDRMTPEAMTSEALNQSYMAGHQTEMPDEMKTFVDEAEAARANLSKYGEEFAKMVSESVDPVETLNKLMNDNYVEDGMIRLFSDDEIAAAADYFQKRSRAQGVMDAAMDRVDLEVEKANAEVRGNTHQQTGQVITAQIGDGTYYIIGGDVATDEETGLPVVAGTGGAVVVKDAMTGEVSVKSPQDILVTSMQNSDDLIQQNETVLRQQLEQQADDDITYGSPANEVYDFEDQVTLQDGNEGLTEGTVVMLPNAVDGVYVIQTNDGRAIQMTADDLNRRIVMHNGMEVQRASQPVNVPENAETGTNGGENVPELTENVQNLTENVQNLTENVQNLTENGEKPTQNVQNSGILDNASGENAPAEDGGQDSNQTRSALDRIPIRTDSQGQPVKGKNGRPILDWHKASVEDAAAALIETTGGDMVMARDTASDLVKNEQARLEKVRKQKPKGDDPIEIAESRVAIRKQEQEVQAIIKQWQDVNQAIQKQMRDEAAARQAEIEAAKSAEQKAREAEEARILKEKQAETDRQRIREQIEKDREKRTREYTPIVKAREEMNGDDEALSILSDTEPRDLEEWVSSLLRPHSMLWQDASDAEIGLQSELGLKRADMQRMMSLLGTKESGAKPFGQVVLDIHEGLPEAMKEQYTDEDVRNTLLNLFNEGSSTRMMHLTEEHRIEEARELQRENARRDAEAEMDAWADAYHLTPEERELFEEYLEMPPTDIEEEIINQIIAENEQNRTSTELDQQSEQRRAGEAAAESQGSVQRPGTEEENQVDNAGNEQSDAEGSGRVEAVPDNNVAPGAQGVEDDPIKAIVIAARNGDKQAQDRLNKFGIRWEKKPVVRFVAQGEVDNILNGGRYEGRFGNGRVDVTNSTDVTTAATADYRITFKDDLDWTLNDRLRMKNEELGDGYIMDGYSLEDVATIEKRNPDGTYTTVYDANNPAAPSESELSELAVRTERTPNPNPSDSGQELGKTSSPEQIAAEEAKVDTNPTEAQKEAGNYQKGHINVDGYDITIENPKGSVRSGVDSKELRWETTMRNTYGYIRGTEGVDGDHIDVFLSDNPTSGKVYVVDQVSPGTGEFDEHKVMYGFASEEEAREAYLSNYSEGWQGLGAITEVSREEFKKWVESSHRKTKPFAEYKSVKKEPAKPEKQHKRLVSDDKMAELRKRLLDKMNNLNEGLDMERMLIGAAYAVGKIERGVTKFADFCADMIEDLGDAIRPYLKLFYNGARDLPEAAELRPLMDDAQTVDAFDVYNFDKKKQPTAIEKAQQVVQERKVRQQAKKIKAEQPDLFAGDLFGAQQEPLNEKQEPSTAQQKPLNKPAKEKQTPKTAELNMPLSEDQFIEKRQKELMNTNPAMDEVTAFNLASDEYRPYIGELIKSGELEDVYSKVSIAQRIAIGKMLDAAGFEVSDVSAKANEERKANEETNQYNVGDQVRAEFFDGTIVEGPIVKTDKGKVTIEQNGRKYTVSEKDIINGQSDNENKLNNDDVISDIDENDVPLQRRSRKSYTDREGVYHEGLEEELEHIEESIRSRLASDTAAGDNGLSSAEVSDVVPVEASEGMVEGTDTQNQELPQRQPTVAEIRRKASMIRTELARRERTKEDLRKKYNINEKGDISLDDLARMFRDLNSDEAIGKMFDRVLDVLKKLKIDYRFTDKLPGGLNGRAQTLLNMTFYDWDAQTRDMDDQQKARVLLHEMIHNVTSQILLYTKKLPLLMMLSPKQLSATRKLNSIYKEVKRANPKRANGKDFYALKDVDEMVAELANPEFREALSHIEVDGRSLWQRIKDAIREMFGLETTPNMSNALKESGDILEDILDTFGPVQSFVHGVPRQAIEAGEKIFGDNENLVDSTEADLGNQEGNNIQDDSANEVNDVVSHKAEEVPETPTQKENSLRDAIVDVLRKIGIDVITDEKEGQHTLEESKGKLSQSKVYHGSAAEFDRFDHSKIGSGEGQAVSGHGTYVTTSEGTARYYANVASERQRKVVQEGGYTLNGNVVRDPALVRAADYLKKADGNVDEAIKACEHTIEVLNRHKDKNPFAALRGSGKSVAEEALDYLHQEKDNPGAIGYQEEIIEKPDRQLYEVEIPDDTGKNYFDLDKKLTKAQKEKFRKAFIEALDKGEDADYWKKNRDIVDYDWKQVEASDAIGDTVRGVMEQFLPSEEVSKIFSNMGYVGSKTKGSDGTTYIIYNDNDLNITGRTKFFRTSDGHTYGYTTNGKIYLDPSIATAETPVHEYTHLWAEAVRQNDPETWDNIVDVLRNDPAVRPFWDKVAAQYPELTDANDIAEEVLAQYSGKRGSEKLREAADDIARENGGIFGKAQAVEALRKMRNILDKFWKAVSDMMGWQYTRAEEVADKVLSDLLNEVKPETEASDTVKEQRAEPPVTPPEDTSEPSAPADPSTEPVKIARQIYEDAIRDTGERMMIPALLRSIGNMEAWIRFKHKFAESYFDYTRSIKALQDAIEKATGKAVQGFEDVWRSLNSKSSIDSVEIQKVMHDLIEPLSEYVGDMIKGKEMDGVPLDVDDVEVYLNAVHGIERNKRMAMKQAQDEYEEDIALQKQQLEKGELSDKERKSIEASLIIKEARFKGIKHYMDNETVAKWYNQWQRGLENALRNGTITEDEYRKSKAKMEEEYEHGQQYKYRNKDYSGLTALFEDDFIDGEKPTEEQLEQAARKYAEKFEEIVGKDVAEGLWERVRALNSWSLRKSYESGLISKDQYNDTLTMYKHYVPLRGWHDDYAGDVYQYISRGEPAEVLQGVLKKAYGRKSRAARIFGTMAAMANTAIVQGNKNLVSQRLLNMAMNHKDSGLLMLGNQYYQKTADGDLIPLAPNLNDRMTADEMREELERFDAEMKAREDAGEVQMLRKKFKKEFPLKMAKWQEQRHAVRVMRGGKEYMVYILGNPRASMAFNGLLNPNTQPGAISNVVNMWNRWLVKWQTSLSPEFLFSNFQRDVMTATTGAYIKYGNDYKRRFEKNVLSVMPLTKATLKRLKGEDARNLGGIFSLFRKYDSGTLDMNDDTERYFKEFIDHGGMTGISYITKAEEYQASMEKMVKRMRQGKMGKVRKGWEAVGEGIEFLNKGIENATRFATYMTSRQQGRTVRESIFDAKEGSVNFNMKGSGAWGNMTARRLYLYVNPSMQALRMLGTWYENDPVVATKEGGKMVTKAVGKRFLKTAAGVITASVTCAIINELLSEVLHGGGDGDDDDKGDWWALSEWNRYNYINVINPFGKGYFHWSIPQELRPLWAMGQIAVDMAFGRKTWQRGLQSMVLQLNNLSPLSFFEGGTDGGETVIESELRTMTPSFLAPFFDAYFWNRDFMGHKITNRASFNKEDPEWKRTGDDTPKLVINASRKLNNITGGADNSRGWLEDNILGGTTNPSALYYLATQQFGGIGSMTKRLFNLIDQATDDEKGVELRNIPFVPKVYVSTGDDYSKQRTLNDKFWMYYNEYRGADHEIKKNKKDVEAKEMTQEYADKRIEERKADGTYNTWKIFEDNDFDYIFDKLRGTKDEDDVKRMVVDAIENGKMPDYDAMLSDPNRNADNDGLFNNARMRQIEHKVDEMKSDEALAEFDKAEDPRLRKQLAKRISKDAGASKDPYGDKPSSDNAYQYQLQRTAEDVREDAMLYALQEKMRDDDKKKDKDVLSKERKQVHSPFEYLHGGKSDPVIMDNIRKNRKRLLEKYGLLKEEK